MRHDRTAQDTFAIIPGLPDMTGRHAMRLDAIRPVAIRFDKTRQHKTRLSAHDGGKINTQGSKMQNSFQAEVKTDATLLEYRMGRVRQLENEIIQQYQNLANAALALGVALKAFRDEKLWQVDGYHSMTHYVIVRCPNLSKRRLYQLLEAAEIAEIIEEHNAESVQFVHSSEQCTNGKLPPIQNEGQARALAAVPDDERIPVYTDAAAAANGHAPTAKQITEARVSRIDTNKALNFDDGVPNQQTIGENFVKAEDGRSLPKRPFGYIPPESICTDHVRKKIVLTFIRPGVPASNLKEYKAAGLSFPWRILTDQGWTPPTVDYHKEEEKYKESLNPFTVKAEPEQVSFAPEETGYLDEAMNNFFEGA